MGPTPHYHPGQVGAGLAARITAKTKKEAVANLFKPASAIVNKVLMEELTDEPCPSLPKPVNLAKAANRLRQRLRPADPVDLEFQLKTEHIPENFLRGDIKVSILSCLKTSMHVWEVCVSFTADSIYRKLTRLYVYTQNSSLTRIARITFCRCFLFNFTSTWAASPHLRQSETARGLVQRQGLVHRRHVQTLQKALQPTTDHKCVRQK